MQPYGGIEGIKITEQSLRPARKVADMIRPKIVDQEILALLQKHHSRNISGEDAEKSNYSGFRP